MSESNFLIPNRLVYLAETPKRTPKAGETAQKNALAELSPKQIKELVDFATKETTRLRESHKRLDPKLKASEGHKQTLRELDGVDRLVQELNRNKELHINRQRKLALDMAMTMLKLINKAPDQVFDQELRVQEDLIRTEWDDKGKNEKMVNASYSPYQKESQKETKKDSSGPIMRENW